MNKAKLLKWFGRVALAAVVCLLAVETLVGKNDLHTWQIVQSMNGYVEVVNEPGWYYRGFAKVTTYPEMMEVFCTKKSIPESPNDDSALAPFNDGGKADIDWYCRAVLPKLTGKETPEEKNLVIAGQRNFHRQFRGPENAILAIRSHGRDCISRSGAIMSSTENQATRKAEFYQVVYDQLKDGFFKMQKVTIRRKDSVTDLLTQAEKNSVVNAEAPKEGETPVRETSSPGSVSVHQPSKVVGEKSVEGTDTVLAAEIVRDKDGKPIVTVLSPLIGYGIKILQFSISATDYDAETTKKFDEKKKYILEAEQNKAEAIKNAQQRLQTIAEGDRKVAETEWKANEIKAKMVIGAQQKQEVATIGKKLAQVQGQTKVKVVTVKAEVSGVLRDIAETKAQIAENEQKAAEILATAKEQMLAMAGAASDYERTLLGIQLEEIEMVTEALKTLKVPKTVIMTTEGSMPGSSPLAGALPSLELLRAFGVTEKQQSVVPSKWRFDPERAPKEPVTKPLPPIPVPMSSSEK